VFFCVQATTVSSFSKDCPDKGGIGFEDLDTASIYRFGRSRLTKVSSYVHSSARRASPS